MSTIIILIIVGAVMWNVAKFYATLKMVKKYHADPESFVTTMKGAAERLDMINAHIVDVKKRRMNMTPEEADEQVKRNVKFTNNFSKMTSNEIKTMTPERFNEIFTDTIDELNESEVAK